MNCDIKAKIRKNALNIRNSKSAESSAEVSSRILMRLMGLSEYREATVIFFFVGTRGETDTTPAVERAIAEGKRVCVPKCGDGGVMEAFEITAMEDLRQGKYGIPEPKDYCAHVGSEEIDLAVVPCVACDRKGNRLGRGGGYYDRYLARRKFTAAALCFDELLYDEIPSEPHDVIVDIVITEEGVYRFDGM